MFIGTGGFGISGLALADILDLSEPRSSDGLDVTVGRPFKGGVDPWMVVALGDSIPFNLEDDCPGCRGFVDQYQVDFQKASGHPVTPRNLSKHTGLRLQGCLTIWRIRRPKHPSHKAM